MYVCVKHSNKGTRVCLASLPLVLAEGKVLRVIITENTNKQKRKSHRRHHVQ